MTRAPSGRTWGHQALGEWRNPVTWGVAMGTQSGRQERRRRGERRLITPSGPASQGTRQLKNLGRSPSSPPCCPKAKGVIWTENFFPRESERALTCGRRQPVVRGAEG